jgi:hypothetical protein
MNMLHEFPMKLEEFYVYVTIATGEIRRLFMNMLHEFPMKLEDCL